MTHRRRPHLTDPSLLGYGPDLVDESEGVRELFPAGLEDRTLGGRQELAQRARAPERQRRARARGQRGGWLHHRGSGRGGGQGGLRDRGCELHSVPDLGRRAARATSPTSTSNGSTLGFFSLPTTTSCLCPTPCASAATARKKSPTPTPTPAPSSPPRPLIGRGRGLLRGDGVSFMVQSRQYLLTIVTPRVPALKKLIILVERMRPVR